MGFFAQDQREIVHGVITVVHEHLDIIQDSGTQVLGFIDGEKQRLPFFFVEIGDLLLNGLEHTGFTALIGNSENGTELFVILTVYAGLYQRRKNIIMTGNPGTGKTHTAIGLGIKVCEQGYRVLYTTIPYLVTELKESNSKQKLRAYQKHFKKYNLIIADELGYMSFDREATDLLFTVLSLRTSQKSTMITSNLTFERWNEIFGDIAITGAIVDRLTYKAYLIDMEGDLYRLHDTLRNNGTNFETVVK